MARDRKPDGRRRVTTTGVKIHKGDTDTWSKAAEVQLVDDTLVVVTQAYCHGGHSLVAPDGARFGGYPGVTLRVKAAGATQDITLSPIHGHHERQGGDGIPEGTACGVACPTCSEQLEAYAPCPCGEGTLRAVYLTSACDKAHVVAVCDVWGCQRSRIVDEWEILSEFVDSEAGPSDPSLVV